LNFCFRQCFPAMKRLKGAAAKAAHIAGFTGSTREPACALLGITHRFDTLSAVEQRFLDRFDTHKGLRAAIRKEALKEAAENDLESVLDSAMELSARLSYMLLQKLVQQSEDERSRRVEIEQRFAQAQIDAMKQIALLQRTLTDDRPADCFAPAQTGGVCFYSAGQYLDESTRELVRHIVDEKVREALARGEGQDDSPLKTEVARLSELVRVSNEKIAKADARRKAAEADALSRAAHAEACQQELQAVEAQFAAFRDQVAEREEETARALDMSQRQARQRAKAEAAEAAAAAAAASEAQILASRKAEEEKAKTKEAMRAKAGEDAESQLKAQLVHCEQQSKDLRAALSQAEERARAAAKAFEEQIASLRSELAARPKQRTTPEHEREAELALAAKDKEIARLGGTISELRVRLNDLLQKLRDRGHGDVVDGLLEETGLDGVCAEMNTAVERCAVFSRLYEDAVRRMTKFAKLAAQVQPDVNPPSELPKDLQRLSRGERGAGAKAQNPAMSASGTKWTRGIPQSPPRRPLSLRVDDSPVHVAVSPTHVPVLRLAGGLDAVPSPAQRRDGRRHLTDSFPTLSGAAKHAGLAGKSDGATADFLGELDFKVMSPTAVSVDRRRGETLSRSAKFGGFALTPAAEGRVGGALSTSASMMLSTNSGGEGLSVSGSSCSS